MNDMQVLIMWAIILWFWGSIVCLFTISTVLVAIRNAKMALGDFC